MSFNVVNGKLTSNMEVNNIVSAPYNLRLENSHGECVFLFGKINLKQDRYLVRVGKGISPLMALAISAARKNYIDCLSIT